MKKTFILLLLFFALFFKSTAIASVELPDIKAEPTPVNYELPYPGILPDSPLYPLKLLREKVNDLLISDPARKADFYLLQSDKRLAASIVLYEDGKLELGEETLSKSLDYHEKAIDKMVEAKKAQDNVEGIFGQLSDSCKKHEEEMKRLKIEKVRKSSDLARENDMRLKELQNRAKTFSP